MRYRPIVLLPLIGGALAAVTLAVFAGKALKEKAPPLPPTGFSPGLAGPAPVLPSEPPDPEQERRWLSRIEQALEEGEDTEEILQLVRSRLQTGAAAPIPLPVPSQITAPQQETGPALSVTLGTTREPTIREIQLAAIRYAEVMPEKISRWRTLSQLRNLVPRLTLGLDRDSDTTIASATSAGKTNFTVGPVDESTSLDFGFTWDLANLVWDSAQTSIDSRSRLMVQLRQDVLKEVTRLYFERKRLRAEFEANPSEDSILLQERSLRLEELAAQLDALTGGLYSAAL